MIQSTLRKENDMSKVTEEVYFRLEKNQLTSLEEWNTLEMELSKTDPGSNAVL